MNNEILFEETPEGSTTRVSDRIHEPPSIDSSGRVTLASSSGAGLSISLWVVDANGREFELPVSNSASPDIEMSGDNGISRWLFQTGIFNDGASGKVEASLAICTSMHASTTWIEVTVHNPSRAVHAGGLWDLGDPGSAFLKGFGFTLHNLDTHNETTALYWCEDPKADPDATTQTMELEDNKSLRLIQHSSGGENWCHRNHVAANGDIPLQIRGWTLQANDETEPSLNGARCEPLVRFGGDKSCSWLVKPQRFWQNFPTAIEVGATHCKFELFKCSVVDSTDRHELQAGEQKRRQVTIASTARSARDLHISNPLPEFASDRVDINQRPPIRPKHSTSFSIPQGIRALSIDDAGERQLLDLLVTAEEFFAKRERIDEFGWRNHGDVFADHESLYAKDSTGAPLVSHYNNQYDLVLGFALQYLRTGDNDWYQLMDELALHVVDIDIYHTTEDRAEYNGGLFWHTNHYTDANTSTHRTFSKLAADPSDPIGTSGGPGPEHCYTTGLMLHWCLTGDTGSRDAVLGLARWIDRWFDGEDLLLAQLWLILRRDVPQAMAAIRGRGNGHALPLSRASGNLLVALLDAYEIEGDKHWLNRAATVLQETFNAEDDIGSRNLLDVERNWSYTIFLQAVLRFLEVKERIGEFDQDFKHAHAGFVAYARWMSMHEITYLEQPEKLEFVNDTWAAQDVRKYVLLMAANRYDPSRADQYKRLAENIIKHIYSQLKCSDERTFTRIQAILLSNIGIASWALAQGASQKVEVETGEQQSKNDSWSQINALINRAVSRLRRISGSPSPKRELQWVLSRLGGRGIDTRKRNR